MNEQEARERFRKRWEAAAKKFREETYPEWKRYEEQWRPLRERYEQIAAPVFAQMRDEQIAAEEELFAELEKIREEENGER